MQINLSHMAKIKTIFMISALVAGGQAWGEDEVPSVSTAQIKTGSKGLLKDEMLAVRPLAGALAYQDSKGANTSRLAVGLAFDLNLSRSITHLSNEWYSGISTGVIISHLGDPSSNFFGADATSQANESSANMMIIPMNLKLGYAFSDYYRLAIHGGANFLHRSNPQSLNLGEDPGSAPATWNLRPNFGVDLNIAVGRNVSISLRPDWTITTGGNLFTGTLGFGFFLG